MRRAIPNPETGRQKHGTIAAGFWFLVCGLTLLGGCHAHRAAPQRAPSPRPARQTAEASDDEWETLPARDEYTGSEACAECHQKNFTAWSRDWHSRALSRAVRSSVVANYGHEHFKGTSSEAWMDRRGSDYVMRTRDREGKISDYPVSWVIGGKRMQDSVTIFPDGRWQVLPVYFHVTGRGQWVDYNEAKQGVVGPDHPFFWTNFRRTANKECLDCHSTGLDTRYDRATHEWRTSFADAGVACEACHGPGARHAETKKVEDIVQPAKIDREVALAICGRCHGPHEPLFPPSDTKDRFRPGQRYEDRYEALVVVEGTQRSGEYFADGRPSSSSFEYQALLQSRCYMRGGATCLSCHTAPHKEHGPDEVKGDVDASCRGCHASVVKEGAAHTHHRSAAGSSCVACHMPRLVSGVLDKFADHTIDVPNPSNTLRHHTPNACGVCHADRSAQQLAREVASLWPDAAARQARRSRLADAIDEATAPASLPALAAVVRDAQEAPVLRGAAATLVAQRFPREARTLLLPLLRDASSVVRTRAIEALGYAGARDASDDIAPRTSDPSVAVRQAAALVLASFNDPRGLAALEHLSTDPATHALVRPHIMLSISAANHGDLKRARDEIETALDLAPYASDALVFLADIEARRGDLRAARAQLEEALRFDPSHRGARARLGLQ